MVLVALSFLAYQPGLRGGFIWDDDVYLTGNRLIHAPDGLARFEALARELGPPPGP